MARHFGEQFQEDWCNKNCDICKKENIQITQLDISTYFEEIKNILSNAVSFEKWNQFLSNPQNLKLGFCKCNKIFKIRSTNL
jgi:hypothetical protein